MERQGFGAALRQRAELPGNRGVKGPARLREAWGKGRGYQKRRLPMARTRLDLEAGGL